VCKNLHGAFDSDVGGQAHYSPGVTLVVSVQTLTRHHCCGDQNVDYKDDAHPEEEDRHKVAPHAYAPSQLASAHTCFLC
jgi:hypothetical protein